MPSWQPGELSPEFSPYQSASVRGIPGELDYSNPNEYGGGGQGGLTTIYDSILSQALQRVDPKIVNRGALGASFDLSTGSDGYLAKSPWDEVSRWLSTSGLPNAQVGADWARQTGVNAWPEFRQKQYNSARNIGEFGKDWLDIAGENIPLIAAATTIGLGGFPGLGDAGMAFGGESAMQGSSYLNNALFNTGGGMIMESGGLDTSGWWDFGIGAEQAPAPVEELIKKTPGLLDRINQQFGTQFGFSDIGTAAKLLTGGRDSYSFPFGRVLGGLLESYGANEQRNDLKSYLDKALTYADPFHDQRPGYQTQFKQLTQDPSNFFKDPAIRSAIDFEGDATGRKLASQGYNMSGNFATGVSDSRMREAFKNYLPYSDMIGTAAGYKFGPGTSGDITSKTGGQIVDLNKQIMGGMGSAANAIGEGSQPIYLEQIFGSNRNQNLNDFFKSWLSPGPA